MITIIIKNNYINEFLNLEDNREEINTDRHSWGWGGDLEGKKGVLPFQKDIQGLIKQNGKGKGYIGT